MQKYIHVFIAAALLTSFANTTASFADHNGGQKIKGRDLMIGVIIGLAGGVALTQKRPQYQDWDEGAYEDGEEDDYVIASHDQPSCVPKGWGGIFPYAKHKNGMWWAKVPPNPDNNRKWEIYEHCEPATCDGASGYRCRGMRGYR